MGLEKPGWWACGLGISDQPGGKASWECSAGVAKETPGTWDTAGTDKGADTTLETVSVSAMEGHHLSGTKAPNFKTKN